MSWLLFALAAVAACYQLLALAASVRHLLRRERRSTVLPPVSILKPVHGRDPCFYEAIRSHAVQDYPEFEILFGVSDPTDPACDDIRRLAAEYPRVKISLSVVRRRAPNGKAAVLEELSHLARHPVLIVNDSDIRVPGDYLRRVTAPLEDAGVGLVTCLYRPRASSAAGAWEALGIATDFMPSVLAAPLVGVGEFGLGSTLAFRAAQLTQIGGFAALEEFLADDYQLARRIVGLGYRVVLSRLVVETFLGDNDWTGVWKHQVRWARTIRVSRSGGYAGLPVTHAGLWGLAALAAGQWQPALALIGLRIAAGCLAGYGVIRSPLALALPLIPLWDLWAFAVWAAGLRGKTVEWRGKRLVLSADGRIRESRYFDAGTIQR